MAVKCAKKQNTTIRVAMIGYGIQARTVLIPNFIKQENVVIKAVCDCDKTRREAGAEHVNSYYKENWQNAKPLPISGIFSMTARLTPLSSPPPTIGTPISPAQP